MVKFSPLMNADSGRARNAVAAGAVTTVLDDWSLPPAHLWAVFPAGRRANRRTRAVVDFLADKLDGRGKPASGAEASPE